MHGYSCRCLDRIEALREALDFVAHARADAIAAATFSPDSESFAHGAAVVADHVRRAVLRRVGEVERECARRALEERTAAGW